jgi:Ca-activated chloride channel family protein
MNAQKASTVTRALTVGVCIAAVAAFSVAVQTKWLQSGGTQSESQPNGSGAGQYFRQVSKLTTAGASPQLKGSGSGGLQAVGPKGKKLGQCALKHTDVSVHISGYIASVDVKQSFHNPFDQKIEAVYTFPLSDSAAVDDMTMKVGDRLIHGTIKRKEEAHQIYQRAKDEGEVASLLDQERPNVFTESVANIDPGKDIDVTIHYVDLLPFESGSYSFVFPTVVGPRFNPGSALNPDDKAVSQSSLASQLRPSKRPAPLSPHIDEMTFAPEGTRSGHDISISVDLDAGLPVDTVCCPLHAIDISPLSPTHAHMALHNQGTIPNKDFVLSWNVGADTLKSGYLTYKNGKSGFLTMMLVPPKRVTTANVAPKEMVFVIDRSGSQDGPPLDKAKETMLYILQHMNPDDTFQIISFADNAEQLFDKPAKVSSFTRSRAESYIQSLTANGGTWLGKAVEKVCSAPEDEHRLRIVTFMTDGEIGNDEEILGMIRKYRGNARWFSFGTGDSVNRFLIDGIAREGGGEADYILLNRPGAEVAEHFYSLISSPVLTDVHVDFDGVQLEDVLPRTVSDVWAERPVYIKARYTRAGKGVAHLHGFAGGKPYNQDIPITLPEVETSHSEIAQIWARSAVDELMALDWFGANDQAFNKKLTEQVIKLALQFHIMTQFTSFVAVDEKSHTSPGQPVLTEVPVDVPEGTSLSGLFSEGDKVVADSLRQALINDTNETLNTWQGQLITGTAPEPKAVVFGSWQAIAKWFDPRSEQFESAKRQVTDIEFIPDQDTGSQPVSAVSSGSGSGFGSVGDEFTSGGTTGSLSNATNLQGGALSEPTTVSQTADTSLPETQFQLIDRSQGAVPTPAPAPKPSPVYSPRLATPALVPAPPPVPHIAYKAAPLSVTSEGGGNVAPLATPVASTLAPNSPQLRGATDGTINLQGSLPYPAIFEKDGKIAEIARSLHIGIIAKLLDFGTLAFGFFFIAKGLVGITSRRSGSWKPIVFGITWIVVGFTFCLVLIPWAIMIVCAQLVRKNKLKHAPITPPLIPSEQESTKVS